MSIWIAKLLGPIVTVLGVHLLVSPARLQQTAAKFLQDTPLIFISGVLAMLGGLAIINTHNIWSWDWRVIITVFGWALLISGAGRILAPQLTTEVGGSMMDRPNMTRAAGLVWATLGLYLSYKGYS